MMQTRSDQNFDISMAKRLGIQYMSTLGYAEVHVAAIDADGHFRIGVKALSFLGLHVPLCLSHGLTQLPIASCMAHRAADR